jgi:hypothetical protein
MRAWGKYIGSAVLTGSLLTGGLALVGGPQETAQAQGLRRQREHHPEILKAITALRVARKHLEEAAHDFGGHRAQALEDTNRALKQLEQCLRFAKNQH